MHCSYSPILPEPTAVGKKKIEHSGLSESRNSLMKNLFTIAVAALALAAFATTTFAGGGGCGACPVSGEKAKKEKTEEATQS